MVPDVLDGLRDLARAARARSPAKIVGVTGSVGKTGTKEALRLTLSRDGETHALVASYNNHWGVPLSLARTPASARYAVFELGMNHAGEIEPLTRLVRPHVAIVTTIEPVHLEFFGSLDAIADAKAEIFLGLEPGGGAVINRDIPQYARRRIAPSGPGSGASCRSASTPRPMRGSSSARCTPTARPCRPASWATMSPTSSARRAGTWCSTRWRCWRRRRFAAPISRWRRWRSINCSRRRGAAPASPSTCRAARRC